MCLKIYAQAWAHFHLIFQSNLTRGKGQRFKFTKVKKKTTKIRLTTDSLGIAWRTTADKIIYVYIIKKKSI